MIVEPKLSIGIPVCNGANFIAELLPNLKAQTFRDFEIVICDNASADGTREVCEKFAKEDSRIRYYRNDVNLGAAKNFDRVFSLSRAPLFKWAACDDLIAPTYLEKCIRILDEHPDVVGAHALPIYVNAHCQPWALDGNGRLYTDPATGVQLPIDPVTGGEIRFAVLRFVDVLFNSRMGLKIYGVFRRKALEHSRLFRPNFFQADKAILLEMALLGRFAHVKENLFIKRFHSGGSAALTDGEQKKWLDPNSGSYSRHVRTVLTFLTAPVGKPVDIFTKLGCVAAVCAYSLMYVPIVGLRSIGLLRIPDDVKVGTDGARPPSRPR
jgi:glycosyltransferase involved in cell wall biosynthesis